MEDAVLSIISNYGGIVSALAATGALIFTAITFRKNDRTRQVQTASDIISELQTLEGQLTEILIAAEKGVSNEEYKLKARTWISTFCNKLDWIAFLILKERIKDKDIREYFKPSFKRLVEGIFYSALVPTDAKEDVSRYMNLKEPYEKLTRSQLVK